MNELSGQTTFNRATVTQVAEAAGVSKMTVSRVVNNKGNVTHKTRKKVLDVINELNYRPNALARGLATRNTNIIGLMLYENVEFSETLLGVQQEMNRNNYDILVFANPFQKNMRPTFRAGLVEGIICSPSHDFDNTLFEYIESENVPYVLMGKRDWKNLKPCFYGIDYIEGFRKATNYLLEMGHRAIAMYGGEADFPADIDKYDGYRQALSEWKIPYDHKLIVYSGEISQFREMLITQKPTAVITMGAESWNHMVTITREIKLTIPRDLSVILFNHAIDRNTVNSFFNIEAMTRIEIPKYEMGVKAAQHLIALLNGEKDLPNENFLQVPIYIGDSCCPPR